MTYIVKYRSIPLNIFIHPSCTQRMLLHFKSLHVNAELCTVLSERFVTQAPSIHYLIY